MENVKIITKAKKFIIMYDCCSTGHANNAKQSNYLKWNKCIQIFHPLPQIDIY